MKNVEKALEGLTMYCEAIAGMDVEEFDFVYNLVVRHGLSNAQIEQLQKALDIAVGNANRKGWG